MNCLDCAIYGTCEQPCDEVESQLPGSRSGGLPGETIYMSEEVLEYVAHKEGMDWEDLTPMKRVFADWEVDVIMDYRFTELQRKFIYHRFFLDLTVRDTKEALGLSVNAGIDWLTEQIKAKMEKAHYRWEIWSAIKDVDFQEEYNSIVNGRIDKCGGMKLKSICIMFYKQLRSKGEIANELNISMNTISKRFEKIDKIVKKQGVGGIKHTAQSL